MGFWKDWYKFISGNANLHMKRISIGIGSFLVLILTAIPLGVDIFLIVLYAGAVETSAMIVMTLFGKNGNGNYSSDKNGVGSSVAAAVDPTPNNH